MIERKKMMKLFNEAKNCIGSYDDFPTFKAGIDPMAYVSRARVPQPCFLSSEKDQTFVVMSGTGRLEAGGSARSDMSLSTGDSVYLPAGVATRITPTTEMLLFKMKAEPPGWEAALWFCQKCGAEVFQREFDASEVVSQLGYWQACQDFNGDPALRTCRECGEVHPEADLTDIRWPEVAEFLTADEKKTAPAAASA
jgi:hypothetical protein